MTTPSATLPRSDFVRAPVLATARPEGYKEWYHFVVHRRGWRLLLNFSLITATSRERPPRLVPRVIVLAHERRWTGVVERFDDAEIGVAAGLGGLDLGGNRMTVSSDGYRISIRLARHGISGELHLTPLGSPSVVVVNNQPLGEAGRLNWLFVPRLRADGWFRLGGHEHLLDDDVAYHDHNWGRFRWGDDFGWTWGSILPSSSADPWSFVFMRRTDRRRLTSVAEALYVWHHGELVALFRDAEVRIRSSGLLGRAPDCTLPPPMRLVLGGAASDVPASVDIRAERAGGVVHAVVHPETHARLAQPSEVSLDRSVVLAETSGAARVTGAVDGTPLDFRGVGVVELLHG